MRSFPLFSFLSLFAAGCAVETQDVGSDWQEDDTCDAEVETQAGDGPFLLEGHQYASQAEFINLGGRCGVHLF